jgi:hypothetical protein
MGIAAAQPGGVVLTAAEPGRLGIGILGASAAAE